MMKEKKVIHKRKRVLAFSLVCLMLVQLAVNDRWMASIQASEGDHKVTVFYGYGGKPGNSNTAANVFANEKNKPSLDNKAYYSTAKSGITDGDFDDSGSSSTLNRYGQTNAAKKIVSADILYGNLKYTMDSYADTTIYLSDDGRSLNRSGGTKLFAFGGGSTAWNAGSTKGLVRFYHIAEDLTIIYHYEDEVTLSVDAGKGAAYSSETGFPGYSAASAETNIFTGYSRPRTDITEGFDTTITYPEGKTAKGAAILIGTEKISVSAEQLRAGFYVNSAYEITTDAADSILKFTNAEGSKAGTLKVYKLESNISIKIAYEEKAPGKEILVKVAGAASATSTPISSSDFTTNVTGGSIDAANGMITLPGTSSINSKGFNLNVNAAYGTVKDIQVVMGEHTWTFDGVKVVSDTKYQSYVNAQFEEEERTSKREGDLFTYVHNSKAKGCSFRFYKLTEDMTITVHYEAVTAKVVDENGYFSEIKYDAYPKDGDAVVEGTTLQISSHVLRGEESDNAHSYRLAFTPGLKAALSGVRVSDKSGTTVLDLTEHNKVYTQDGLGKMKFAYDKGIYYVRVFGQTASELDFSPIVNYEYVNKGYSNVKLETSREFSVRYEDGYPKQATVSTDKMTVMVPEGTLTEGTAKKSFRWSLGSTLDNAYEYGALEIYGTVKDQNGQEHTQLLATLGSNAKSYLEDGKKDQTFTYSSEFVKVKYNKSKYGQAQIRFWETSGVMDFTFKMTCKNYETGESADAAGVTFDTRQSIRIYGTYSDWTVDHRLPNMGIDIVGNQVTFDNKYLTGEATQDATGCYGNLRLALTEKKGYEIQSVTVTDVSDSSKTYTFQVPKDRTSASYTGGLGNMAFAFSNGKYYLRFSDMMVRDVKVDVDYKLVSTGTPYVVALSGIAAGNTEVKIDGADILGVSVSSNALSAQIANENTLPEGTKNKSIRWNLSSTYGSGWEYYKLEVYSAKTGRLYCTLGDKFESFLADADKDQMTGANLSGISVKYNKDKYGNAQIRVWNVSKDYVLKLYYKNYETGQVTAADQATVHVKYGGTVSYNDNSVRLEMENANSTTVKVTTKLEQKQGVKYYVYTKKLGDNVESIAVTANGRSYTLGGGLKSGQSVTQEILGAKLTYYKSTDGYAQVRIWNVVGNISLTTNLSHNNSYSILFDEGDHGIFSVKEMPGSAVYNDNMTRITVPQGATHNSKSGNATSILYNVTPDVGYELDCITVTVDGTSYRLDHRDVASGKTLLTKIMPNISVRYNVDSNGNAQIRMVHVDSNVSVKVSYREDEYTVTVFTQYKGVMKAEAYETSALFTVFSDNFAVAKVVSGTTGGRGNGIKYWVKPINEGDIITSAVLRNKFGDYIIMGGDEFSEEDYKDYRIKGGVVRYYKGYNGIIEMRIWGVYEDLEIICFYNGETPDPNMVIPDDVGTYDLGEYGGNVGYVDEPIEPIEPIETAAVKRGIPWIPILIGAGALIGLGVIFFLILHLRKKGKKEDVV